MKLSRPIWTLLVIIFLLPIGVATNVASGGGGDDDPGLPDLVPALAPGSTFYFSQLGDTPDFILYVRNAGSVSSAGVWVDVRFRDSSGVYTTVRSLTNTGTLAPGQTHTGVTVERPDINWPAGDMVIQITVDPDNDVTESNENNNVQLTTIIG